MQASIHVQQVPLDDLRPDPANPRRITEEQREALVRSMRTYGPVEPIVVNRQSREVIGGHQRLVAARELGWTEVPVVFVDLTRTPARLLGLALNKTGGLGRGIASAAAGRAAGRGSFKLNRFSSPSRLWCGNRPWTLPRACES